jgi:hypothetical protein
MPPSKVKVHLVIRARGLLADLVEDIVIWIEGSS